MSEQDEPKKQLETTRGGSGRKIKTAVGSGEGGGRDDVDPGAAGDDESPGADRRKAVVCDRSELIRAGWRAMLRPFAEVVDEAGDGAAAIAAINLRRPGLVVLDIDLNIVSGLDVCKTVAKEFPVVVATSSYEATKCFHRLLRSGVTAIVLKSSGPATLFDAIRIGSRSSAYIDPKIAPLTRQQPATRDKKLTDREQEVLIRLDLRNKEIADELELMPRTVEKHIECILAKLKVPTRTSAALKAVQMGYILLPYMPRRDPETSMTCEEIEANRHAQEAINKRRSS